MLREEEIINDIVYALKEKTNLEDVYYKESPSRYLYDYTLIINGVVFACEIKRQVNRANVNLVVQQMRRLKELTDIPILLAALHITPDVFEILSREGISVVDASGNCKIFAGQMFIQVSGQKNQWNNYIKRRAFTETGLKLVFYFLLEDSNINKPYRQINQETGLSLGTIKNVVEELTVSQFVLTTHNGRFLKNKKELLDVWQVHYNQDLKPKLLLKEMEFTSTEAQKEWIILTLPKGMCWGGEGGAFLLDHYLIPEQFDIYTEVPSVKLMMTRKMTFKEGGSVRVYQKFWNGVDAQGVAPRILVYADLMGSGNSRCIEAAQRLIDNGV